MQEEYPDSVRESLQLFAFKSDRLPARAWDNPRFIPLKDKWTYRQVDSAPAALDMTTVLPEPRFKRHSKSLSLGRMMSTPSLRSIGERPQMAPHKRTDSAIEDPFIDDTVLPTMPSTIDLLELNRTLDRMQMMMNQTNLRIDSLAEKQQLLVQNLENIRAAIDNNAKQIRSLSKANDSAVTHTKTAQEVDQQLHKSSVRMDEVVTSQKVSQDDMRQTRIVTEQTAELCETLLNRQNSHDRKVDDLSSQLEQSIKESCEFRSLDSAPPPFDLQKLQGAVEQQSSQLTALVTGIKVTNKNMVDQQANLKQITADHGNVTRRLDKMQALKDQEMDLLKVKIAKDGARFDQLQSAIQTGMNQTMAMSKQQASRHNTRLEHQTAMLESRIDRVQASNAEQQEQTAEMFAQLMVMLEKREKDNVVKCNHEVMPPPRKVNKNIIGYVYSKQ